jgi:Cu/Ag efflux pump CusA
MNTKSSRQRVRIFLLAIGAVVLAALIVSGFFFFKGRLFPTPDPVLIDVLALYPGASPEEVQRLVTQPLEVAFTGTPGLRVLRSKSLPGSASLQAEFDPRIDYSEARKEILNRLQFCAELPAGVTPQISATSCRPATFRYILRTPRDTAEREIYTLSDVRAIQDGVLEREFRRLPRILDVSSAGGTVQRYEVNPDPNRMRRFGITFTQVETTIKNSNQTVAGNDTPTVRDVTLFGGREDPTREARKMKDPRAATALLRADEQQRINEIRNLDIANFNDLPVLVGDVVDGGRAAPGDLRWCGVFVSHSRRSGQVGETYCETDSEGKMIRTAAGDLWWVDRDDCVQGVITLRPGEDEQTAWRDVRAKIEALNAPASGELLPAMRIEPYLEGNSPDHFWVSATLPIEITLDRAGVVARQARAVVQGYPEAARIISEVGDPDGTVPVGLIAGRLCVVLRPSQEWPATVEGIGGKRTRNKQELMGAVLAELQKKLPGIDWACSTEKREGLWGEFTAGPGELVLKIVGPDRDQLEQLAALAKPRLEEAARVQSVSVLHVRGRTQFEFRIDPEKCRRWGVPVADASLVLRSALGAKELGNMLEWEKPSAVAVRWPGLMQKDESTILDLPLDILNDRLVPAREPGVGVPPAGEKVIDPANPIGKSPRLRLRDLVSPAGDDGRTAAIYREQGQRLILLRVTLGGGDGASVRAEAEPKIAPAVIAGYRLEWDIGR